MLTTSVAADSTMADFASCASAARWSAERSSLVNRSSRERSRPHYSSSSSKEHRRIELQTERPRPSLSRLLLDNMRRQRHRGGGQGSSVFTYAKTNVPTT